MEKSQVKGIERGKRHHCHHLQRKGRCMEKSQVKGIERQITSFELCIGTIKDAWKNPK